MPIDQPTDAGKDRETATGIVGNVSDYLLGDTAGVLANTIFLALQRARREGRAQEREACAKVAETCPPKNDPWWQSEDGVDRWIAAAIRAREEPSR